MRSASSAAPARTPLVREYFNNNKQDTKKHRLLLLKNLFFICLEKGATNVFLS
jgi:hypothetical protein